MFQKANQHPDVTECATCHDAHGSAESSLLLEKQRSLCGTCHDDVSETHLHPFEAPAVDPRTGTELRCASCHDPHSSNHEQLMTHAKGRELCIQCHRGQNLKVRGTR
jgi:predicted CXXCH cytochrome family protein